MKRNPENTGLNAARGVKSGESRRTSGLSAGPKCDSTGEIRGKIVELEDSTLQSVELQDAELQEPELQASELQSSGLQSSEDQDSVFRACEEQGSAFREPNIKDSELQAPEDQASVLRAFKEQGSESRDPKIEDSEVPDSELREGKNPDSENQISDDQASLLRAFEEQVSVDQDSKIRQSEVRQPKLQDSDLEDSHLRVSDPQAPHLRGSELQDSDLQDSRPQDSEFQDSEFQVFAHPDSDRPGVDLKAAEFENDELQNAEGKRDRQHPSEDGAISPEGRAYWRSIEEALEPSLRELREGEFPPGADLPPDALSRRRFLSLLGASAALGGAAGACMQSPREAIVPYTQTPKEVVPGLPLNYATTLTRQGLAVGVVVASREGRPIKIEGNEDHPASLGATGPHEQAALLQLYDPERSQSLSQNGEPRSWRNFYDTFAPRGRRPLGRGEGLHFLLEPTSSAVVGALLRRLSAEYPEARFHSYAPFWQGGSKSSVGMESGGRAQGAEGEGEGPGSSSGAAGEEEARGSNGPSGKGQVSGGFAVRGLAAVGRGRGLFPKHDLQSARVILSLDSDFLGPVHPQFLHLSRQFSEGRKVQGSERPRNRLYVVEPSLSVTGMSADHRLPLKGSGISAFALALLTEIAASSRGEMPPSLLQVLSSRSTFSDSSGFLQGLAQDLLDNRGRCVVMAGERQPPVLHALAHCLNELLGNVGQTLSYLQLPWVSLNGGDLNSLVEAIRTEEVRTLFILGGNPVYASPSGMELDSLIRSVPRSVYLGLYRNETALACDWFLPQSHPLESWGDSRAFDGTLSLSQPLIAPMYGGRSTAEVLSALAGERIGGHELLMRTLAEEFELPSSDAQERAVQRGFVEDTAFEPEDFETDWSALPSLLEQIPQSGDGLELALAPDYSVLDGSFSNNPWLQELPDPVSKLTWDNALSLSLSTAQRLGLKSEELVRLEVEGNSLEVPVLLMPGQADDCLSLTVGYGRSTPVENVANGVGFNAWKLAPENGSLFAPTSLVRTHRKHRLAITQSHWSMEGRDPAHTVTADSFSSNPTQFKNTHSIVSLYEPFKEQGMQWAMSVDLGACTGCNACVVACQAENNIPVVGKADVLRSREMHWIRIDRYFIGSPENPKAVTQPMLCQHCEKAPCEYVCPVNATTHSPDGINEMTYNRCVGTRFCSNNCPYKVRRFNWFDYTGKTPPELRLAMNPEVTVRQRGVMEKCTFCVQRVRNAQIRSRVNEVPLEDGDVKTACQQVCPTRAITFGSIADPESEVSKLSQEPRSYAVLEELGVRPRVRYLARITNPNPKLS